MKSIYLTIASIAFNLLFVQFLPAQENSIGASARKEKTITERQLSTLEYEATEKLDAGNYRTTTIKELFPGTNTSPTEIRVKIYESSTNNRTRVISEIKQAGEILSKTGFMLIGKDRYSLNSEGKWILNSASGYGSGSGSGNGVPTPDTRIYKFIGQSKINNRLVHIYEVRGKYTTMFDDSSVETDVQMHYWFTLDGKLLRIEGTDYYAALNLKVKTTITNEYNAVVNIQLPPK